MSSPNVSSSVLQSFFASWWVYWSTAIVFIFIMVIIVCTCVNQSVNSLTIEQIHKIIVSKKVNSLINKLLRNKLHLWNRKFLFLLVQIILFYFGGFTPYGC